MGRCLFTFDSTTEKGMSLGQLITVEDFSSDSRVIDLSSIANRKPILSVSNSNFEGGVGIGETISSSYAVFCLKKKKLRNGLFRGGGEIPSSAQNLGTRNERKVSR